jgi:hypothetical protein
MPDAKQVGVGVAFLIVVLIFVLAVTRPWKTIIKHKTAQSSNNTTRRPAARTLPRASASQATKSRKEQRVKQPVISALPPMIASSAESESPAMQLPAFPIMPNDMSFPLGMQTPVPNFPIPTPQTDIQNNMTYPPFQAQTPAVPQVQTFQQAPSFPITSPQEDKPEDTLQSNHRAELLRGSSAGRTKTATPTTAALMMASINTREENGKTSEGSTALMERLTGRSVSQAERDFLNGKDTNTVPEPYRP